MNCYLFIIYFFYLLFIYCGFYLLLLLIVSMLGIMTINIGELLQLHFIYDFFLPFSFSFFPEEITIFLSHFNRITV